MLAGATAIHCLAATSAAAGDTVLVHGASGGVGLMLVELAVGRGMTVIGTASERNHEALRALGAVPTVYGDGLLERVRELAPDGVDVAIDCIGSDEAMAVSLELVADRSRVATIVAFARGRRRADQRPRERPRRGPRHRHPQRGTSRAGRPRRRGEAACADPDDAAVRRSRGAPRGGRAAHPRQGRLDPIGAARPARSFAAPQRPNWRANSLARRGTSVSAWRVRARSSRSCGSPTSTGSIESWSVDSAVSASAV